ncbi:MAG: Late competence protein ComEC, DNA transport [Candidatus Saccharicenans subterraneus]|uniref:Late competence protein ComEC, DNA transport n=1 Tax=Candidatus Saccharicenans subterraneus TaxID=2508984 RepID=A0A3E2BNA7_9BACT|nr:MAG: Late competence protein ComEC, DNA transport [Candidatus Saccharicenans subterraneum]
MPAPLLLPALSFIAGILFSIVLKSAYSWHLVLLTGITIAVGWLGYCFRKERAAFWLILAGFFLAGFGLCSLEYSRHQNNELRQLRVEGYLDFKGRVLRSPERRADRDILIIKVEEVRVSGVEKRIKGHLRLTVAHSSTSQEPLELLAGDRVEFSATLSPEDTFRNFFPDFMPRYLRSQRIQARAFAKSPLLIKKINQKNHTPAGFFSGLRRKLQKGIEKDFPGPDRFTLAAEGAVLEALLLGADGRLDPETDRQFQKTGLYHLLAISGAHVAVVSLLFYSFLGLFITRKRTIQLILLAVLIFYAFLVEGQPSVFRAVIMTSLFLLGKLISADTNLLNTLALSALVLLVINPFSLEDVGFQLTFLATLSLVLFFKPIFKVLPKLPFRVSEMTAMSLAAVAGTMPVIISNFNRVTFASLILNLPAAPLMGLIMAVGYIYLAVNLMLPAAGHLLSFVLKYLIRFFSWVAAWLEPFNSLSYRLPSPPTMVVIGFYLCLLLLLAKPRFRYQKLLTAAGLSVFFLVMIIYPFRPHNERLTVTFMDVGQGDSLVVEFPGSRVMVIDAGGFVQGSFDPGESLVSPYLWHRGYKKIDYLVCSHFHPDHAGGLPALARNFRVGEFWSVEEKGNRLSEEINRVLSRKTRKKMLRAGLSQVIDGCRVEVLYPDEQAEALFHPGNDLSVILKLDCAEQSFLLAADITAPVEDYLVRLWPGKLEATVLKVPHHGSRSSASPTFLEAVSPRWAVITAGRNNVYGFPDLEVLERLEAAGIEVLRIDRDGAVRFEQGASGLVIRTAAAGMN